MKANQGSCGWCLAWVTSLLISAGGCVTRTVSGPNATSAGPPVEASVLGLTTLSVQPYRGWPSAVILSNGKVEAVIVPDVGRVMDFRFVGETDGPFWQNRALLGKIPNPGNDPWQNFGGDKSWPAPQADWQKITSKSWPPPVMFDSMPMDADIKRGQVTLISAVDPDYGIRVIREIRLHGSEAAMEIVTTYQKVQGEPVRVAVWTVTQLDDPEKIFIPRRQSSLFLKGYVLQSGGLPAGWVLEDQWISLARDRQNPHKIGSDADRLIWIGSRSALRMEGPRISGREYPDGGSSAEVYTNPDPLGYVELEFLGPMGSLKVGESTQLTCRYHLFRRARDDARAELRRVAPP